MENTTFLSEDKMEEFFVDKFGSVGEQSLGKGMNWPFYMWYSKEYTHDLTLVHHEKIAPGKIYDCDTITDKFIGWLLSTPKSVNPFSNPGDMGAAPNAYSDSNAFLFEKDETIVYFIAASPFRDPPDFRRVIMTRKAHILIPVYIVITSPALYTFEKSEDYVEMMKQDLSGINKDSVTASFDRKPIYGCCVMRNTPLKVKNIPRDNIYGIPENRLIDSNHEIEVYAGGFWLLINGEKITPGDHYLQFKAQSINYEISARILITALI